jgi:hypothetical protein
VNCIFCKNISSNSTSVEHVIPESLGNIEHVLPQGWVCDNCNNYFAREIEKPFLDSLYGRISRFEMHVPNKKNRIPSAPGYHMQSRTRIEMFYHPEDDQLSVGAAEGEDETRWITSIKNKEPGTLCVLASNTPENDYVIARFIGKVALETLAYRCLDIAEWNDEIVNKFELDKLRKYVRLGNPKLIWPVHIRRIYSQEQKFTDFQYGSYQILHEWDILCTHQGEFFAIIAIFGIEYAINLGGPELEGYINWLNENNNKSPLCSGKNEMHS